MKWSYASNVFAWHLYKTPKNQRLTSKSWLKPRGFFAWRLKSSSSKAMPQPHVTQASMLPVAVQHCSCWVSLLMFKYSVSEFMTSTSSEATHCSSSISCCSSCCSSSRWGTDDTIILFWRIGNNLSDSDYRWLQSSLCLRMYVCMYACVCVCVYVCVCACVYVCIVCMYVYMYVFFYVRMYKYVGM